MEQLIYSLNFSSTFQILFRMLSSISIFYAVRRHKYLSFEQAKALADAFNESQLVQLMHSNLKAC